MTILEAIKKEGLRLNARGMERWLGISEYDSNFVVYERKYRARHTQELYRGDDEAEAVRILLGGE